MIQFYAWMGRSIELSIRADPEHHLVGEIKKGIFRKRRLWVHIQGGKLVGTAEINVGFLGELGSSSRPFYLKGEEAHKYFAQHGVPENVYKELIEPAISS